MEQPSALPIESKVHWKNHYHETFLAYFWFIFKKAPGNFINIDKNIMLKYDSLRPTIKYVVIP